jgi:lipoprotein-releasing system permease protein
MPFELFLALRYLRVRRGRRVARWTALAAVAGIACGVAALIVALALANGFRDELRDKILRGTAHLTLSREGGLSVAEARAAAERLRAVAGVREAAPTTYAGALLTGPSGAAYTVLRGVDADSERARSELRRTLVRGEAESLFENRPPAAQQNVPPENAESGKVGDETAEAGVAEASEAPAPVVVGEELAARAGLARVGDEGWLLTDGRLPGAAEFEPRARRVRVAGVFRSGLYEYDAAWTYLPLAEAIGGADSSPVVGVEAADIYAVGEVAARARGALGPGWAALDWREANRPLFAALELERRTVSLIILLIMVVAALNITTTLALVVVERRADIAVLATLGARPRSIMTVFVIEGACIGALGALLGVALGLVACALGERFELVRLPPDVYSLSAVPFHPHAADVLWPAFAAFAVSLLATLYPARQAARVRPAEALRYE